MQIFKQGAENVIQRLHLHYIYTPDVNVMQKRPLPPLHHIYAKI